MGILILVIALVGTILAAVGYTYGGPLLHIGVVFIGVAVCLLALAGAGLHAPSALMPLLGL